MIGVVFLHARWTDTRQESRCPCGRSSQHDLRSGGFDVLNMIVVLVAGSGLCRIAVARTAQARGSTCRVKSVIDRQRSGSRRALPDEEVCSSHEALLLKAMLPDSRR